MNRVFVAKLDDATYTYDNNGHIHVPPLQPGRLPPAISPPRGSESDMTAAIAAPPAEPGSVRNVFGSMFASRGSAEPAVASADSGSHAGFFSGLFGSKGDAGRNRRRPLPAPVQTATASRAHLSCGHRCGPRRQPPRASGRRAQPGAAKLRTLAAAKPKAAAPERAGERVCAAAEQRHDQRRAARRAGRQLQQPLGRLLIIGIFEIGDLESRRRRAGLRCALYVASVAVLELLA